MSCRFCQAGVSGSFQALRAVTVGEWGRHIARSMSGPGTLRCRGKAVVHCSDDPLQMGSRGKRSRRLAAEHPFGQPSGEEGSVRGVTGQARTLRLAFGNLRQKAVQHEGGSCHGRGARDWAGHCA